MGQAKSKIDCPLCGSRVDPDEAICDSVPPSPTKADAPYAVSVFVPSDDTALRCGGTGSHVSQYVAVPLTSVAEEPSSVGGDGAADGEAQTGSASQVTSPANHLTSSSSFRNSVVVLRGGNVRHHGSGGHRVRFDVENGSVAGGVGRGSSGGSLSISGGGGPPISYGGGFPQRRESFLYRSDSDFEMSPKSAGSRNSSVTSEQQHGMAGEDLIVTPFAQILHSLHNVHRNYMMLTNVTSNRSKRRSSNLDKSDVTAAATSAAVVGASTSSQGPGAVNEPAAPSIDAVKSTSATDPSSVDVVKPQPPQPPACTVSLSPPSAEDVKMMVDTLDELEWCLEQLETIQTHKSVSDMATSKFKKLLNKELHQFAESSKAGNQISEYISSTFLDKQQDLDLSAASSGVDGESEAASAGNSATSQPPSRRGSTSSGGLASSGSSSLTHNAITKKKPSKKSAPMSSIPGIRSSSSKYHQQLQQHAKRGNGVLPKYGVQASNGELLAECMNDVNCWGMPIFDLSKLTNDRPLTAVTFTILQERGLTKTFKISPVTLLAYLTRVEDHYHRDVPYHNSTHAADVTQSSHVLLSMPSLAKIFTDLEVLATLFASAIHDVDHPGVTNQYLINTGSELALMYNDESVLESHHLAVAFKLLQEDGLDVLQSLPAKSRQTLRRIVIEIVLATDMNKHMDHIANLKTMVETHKLSGSSVLSLETYSERVQVLKSLVHCSDLSNPTKPLELYRHWVDRIMQEFFRQGDLEREHKLDISPMCDRHTATVEKTQTKSTQIAQSAIAEQSILLSAIRDTTVQALGPQRGTDHSIKVGFIDYIVHPLWETWADLVHPDCQEILDVLEDNREWYKSRIATSPSEDLTAGGHKATVKQAAAIKSSKSRTSSMQGPPASKSLMTSTATESKASSSTSASAADTASPVDSPTSTSRSGLADCSTDSAAVGDGGDQSAGDAILHPDMAAVRPATISTSTNQAGSRSTSPSSTIASTTVAEAGGGSDSTRDVSADVTLTANLKSPSTTETQLPVSESANGCQNQQQPSATDTSQTVT